MNDIVIVSI